MKKLKPRFFCDNCGFEVDGDIKACPHCGRYFASVRCPVCGYSGPDKMFQSGCPLCGYSAPPVPKTAKNSPKKVKKEHIPNEPLPFWALIIAFISFFAALIFLFQFLTK
ncbi:MAG: hypothetical protein LBU88_05600 [Treponema sp.]|jgi:uncharacterized membrane protein YvbJ|nr:hypothetical protein [Treponema sp.]